MKRIYFILALVSVLGGSVSAQTLTLEECLLSAVAYNRTLQNAALDIQAASQQRREAYTNYYPQISANVLAFHSFDKLIQGNLPASLAFLGQPFASLAGLSFDAIDKGYSAVLSAVEPVYAGGKIKAANDLTRIQEDVMYLQHSLKEKDVRQKVTENFWQIVSVKFNLQTIEASGKHLDEVERQTELFVKTGVATRNALLKIHINRQELESNRLSLQNAEHLFLLLLSQQIGMMGKDIDISVPETEPADPAVVHVVSADAAALREELQLAGKNVDANLLQIKMERANSMPTFAVGVMGNHTQFGGLTDMMKESIRSGLFNGMVFGTISVPISSWWGGSHAIKRMKIRHQQSRNDYLEAQEKLQLDIESSWSNLTESFQQITIAKASVDEAEENLRMSKEQYRVGTETLSDLLDAESLNRKSHDKYSAALAAYQVRLADYLRKTGR